MHVIRQFPKEIILSALLRMPEQIPFYVVTAFVLSYMTSGSNGHDYTYNFAPIGTLVDAGMDFILVPVFGLYSDTIGRKEIYAWGAAIMGVWGFVYFALLDSGVTWLAFVALCLGPVPHAMQYGPQASIIAESFPTNLRYTGAGLGYQLSSIIAGGPTVLIATWLIHQFGTGYAASVYILISAVITLVALKFLKDRSRSEITDDRTYA